jgi:serine/threonine protein kinase
MCGSLYSELCFPCRYLHESVQPPVVHQNFEPENVLLDNKVSVCVAECGLAELMPSNSVTQVSYNIWYRIDFACSKGTESWAWLGLFKD